MAYMRSPFVLRLVCPIALSGLVPLGLAACGGGDDTSVPVVMGDAGDGGPRDGTTDQGAPDTATDAPNADVDAAGDAPSDATDGGRRLDASDASDAPDGGGEASLDSINHFVIIYMENHSFDNLYGEFAGADGLTNLDAGAPTVAQLNAPNGVPYTTLPFPAPLTADGGAFAGASLPNAPFPIETFVPANVDTPTDLNHIFFTEQIQIADGGMNLFVYQSNALGLSMGYYHTNNLPVPTEAKNWTVCDHFFHSAFGGSFLNHHFLIAAAPPVWDPNVTPLPDADGGVGPVYDDPALAAGQGEGYIWHDPSTFADGGAGTYYVVNTSFSVNSPHVPASGRGLPPYLVPNQTNVTIGDRLTAANITWAWYSGGWNDALAASNDAGVPDGGSTPTADEFQYHHQPFIYYTNYADGMPGRAHLKDEVDFKAAAAAGTLPAVSFIKPAGINNEHPGYTDVVTGDNHLLGLIQAVQASPNWNETAIIITYDEHGGFWDHVPPPGGDKWGPGSRVPTIVISPFAKTHNVDHTVYDTTSILATIEKRWNLAPLNARDQHAPPMLSVFTFSP
jgi:acid phosphatase